MPLNFVKPNSNMYGFINATWNVIKGKCPHDCAYCYMKRFKQSPLHFDEKELKTDLGEGNFIFVGSSCDMWAYGISEEWISMILEYCLQFPKNRFLFQSKNPQRFREFYGKFSSQSVLGTTLESNREYPEIYRDARPVFERHLSISEVCKEDGNEVMITIEPILDFDFKEFADMIYDIEPSWVNIGADSKGHNLPEPPPEKIMDLIAELNTFTEVNIKKNLKRIIGVKCPS